MAKLTGVIDDYRLRRQKGQPIVRELNGQVIAQAWPCKETRARKLKAEYARAIFVARNLIMKYADPLQIAAAYNFTKDSEYAPRDVLLMAISGTLFQSFSLDGKTYYSRALQRDVSKMLDYIF